MNLKNIVFSAIIAVSSAILIPNISQAQFTDIGNNLPLANCVACGDYDNDGRPDIAISTEDTTKIYHNDGNGKFSDIGVNLAGVKYGSLAWGDYDNDGLLDLAIAGQQNYNTFISKIYHNDGNGKFTDIGANLIGVRYCALAWGDYDNDGDLDLAIAGHSYSFGYITRIYRNDGNGVFTNSGISMDGTEYGSIAWVDYDNDGDLDLILSGGESSSTVIYRNDGNGKFTDIKANIINVSDSSMAWGDYDNDGKLDLAISGLYGPKLDTTSRIYHNDGNGVFTDIGANLSGIYSGSVFWGDFDNDGKLDLAIAGAGTYANALNDINKIYHNNGNNTFSDSNSISDDIYSRACLDYDQDGDLDLLTVGCNSSNNFTTIFQNKTSSSNTPPNAPSGLSAVVSGTSVTFSWNAASDVETPASGLSYNLRVGTTPGSSDIFSGMADSSGRRNISALGNTQKMLTWTIKNLKPHTYYWSVQTIDTSYLGSAWADEKSIAVEAVKISGRIKDADGNAISSAYVSASNGGPIVISDSNGYYELYVPNGWSGSVASTKQGICFMPTKKTYTDVTSDQVDQDYTELFTDIGTSLTTVSTGSAAWGDYDNDGSLDLVVEGDAYVVGSASSKIYHNDGSGKFTDIGAGIDNLYYGSAAWGDYDNDGDLDLAITGFNSNGYCRTKVYRNDGNGIFTDIGVSIPGLGGGCDIAWGDYDNDGKLDLAVAGSSTAGNIARIYHNDGNDKFTDIGANLSSVDRCSLAWGDLDNDGDLDLVIVGSYYLTIYRNDGNGKFTPTILWGGGTVLGDVSLCDYDNDGDLDIAVMGNSPTGNIVKIYRNDGNLKFTDIAANITGVAYGSLSWGDYDNDGYSDLIVSGSYSCKIYHNDRNGTFNDIGADLPDVSSSSVAFGDCDNDFDLDFIVLGNDYNGRVTCLYRNDTLTHNTPPSAPSGLTTVINGSDVTFQWNAATDAQTPSAGLSYNLRVGTAPGAANIFSGMADSSNGFRKIPAFGNAQKNLSWTLHNLPSCKLYWSVQAIDTSYVGSAWANEDTGYVITNKTKQLADGSTTCIAGVVTAVFSDCCYVESEDRSSGIKIESSDSVKVGDKVYVSGSMSTDSDGERYISSATVTAIGSGSMNPLCLINKNLGGGDFNLTSTTGQCGVSGCFGLNNIGMLVKTTGKVLSVGEGYFYIDDGSDVQDATFNGIRVTCESAISTPEKDQYVIVTGISSIMKADGRYYRDLRAINVKQIK